MIQLSQVLQYDFLADSKEIMSDAGETGKIVTSFTDETLPQPPSKLRHRRRWWWVLAGVVVCLLVVAAAVGWRLARRDTAEIVVRYRAPVEYWGRMEGGVMGYEAIFMIENESDVPFKPVRIKGLYYNGDQMVNKIEGLYDEIAWWMDSDKMYKKNLPLYWPLRTDDSTLTHVECVVEGRDDNGHWISERAVVRFSSQKPQQEET